MQLQLTRRDLFFLASALYLHPVSPVQREKSIYFGFSSNDIGQLMKYDIQKEKALVKKVNFKKPHEFISFKNNKILVIEKRGTNIIEIDRCDLEISRRFESKKLNMYGHGVLTRDNKFLYVTSYDPQSLKGSLLKINTINFQQTKVINTGGHYPHQVVRLNRFHLVTGNAFTKRENDPGNLVVIDTRNDEIVRTIKLPGMNHKIDHIYSFNENKIICPLIGFKEKGQYGHAPLMIWNQSDSKSNFIPYPNQNQLGYLPDSILKVSPTLVLVSNHLKSELTLWDIDKMLFVDRLKCPGPLGLSLLKASINETKVLVNCHGMKLIWLNVRGGRMIIQKEKSLLTIGNNRLGYEAHSYLI